MKDIKTLAQLVESYGNGQRIFTGLEFENGEVFRGLDLTGCTFINCWFCADFSDTNLTRCRFRDCNLKTSNFSKANLTKANITNCSVEEVIFKNAILTEFVFENNYAYGNIVGQNDLNIFEL